MAVLTDANYTEIRQIVKSNPDAWSSHKGMGLSKPVWENTYQAAEDWFVDGFAITPTESFTAALEGEAGSMTNAEAKWIGKVWFEWRVGQDW